MILSAILERNGKIHPLMVYLVAGAVSIAALIASARIQVPMIPVPITFQTVVVLMLPCLLGTRGALGALFGYMALGALGLPVFAITTGALPGLAYFAGPTGGYLAGFVVAAALVGFLCETRRPDTLPILFMLMLLGHTAILLCGVLWLAYGLPHIGINAAISGGLIPFLSGSLLKAGIAAAFVRHLQKK